ncbi:hypothetical protein NKI20_22160 [Mesorhizobium sp. M0830]|uniref:hypothetical protein n=1 Tax=Mesorhizobium sp. M0830 TaxID=2957008 RepID=UPI00333B246F
MVRVVRNRKRAEASFQPGDHAGWDRLFDVNVMSGVRLSSAYLPGMLERKWASGNVAAHGDLPAQTMSHVPSTPAAGVSISSSTPPD